MKSHSTTIFLWFSYGFPMVFLWFSYGFPMVFPWFSYGFPMALNHVTDETRAGSGSSPSVAGPKELDQFGREVPASGAWTLFGALGSLGSGCFF